LTGSVEQNLVFVDHVSGVLGSVLRLVRFDCFERRQSSTYIHSITTSGYFTSVAFSKSPVERVGESIFAKIGKNLIVNLESRKIGFVKRLV
jgi:hypothetical protein